MKKYMSFFMGILILSAVMLCGCGNRAFELVNFSQHSELDSLSTTPKHANSPCNIIFLEELKEDGNTGDFPDLSVPYSNAKFPEDWQNSLTQNGTFNAIPDKTDTILWIEFMYDDSPSMSKSTNYFARFIFDNHLTMILRRPIIYFDDGEFYVEGLSTCDYQGISRNQLVRYSCSTNTFEIIADDVNGMDAENLSFV